MTNVICLDKKYSTTRLVIEEKPILEKKSEYQLEPKLFLSHTSEVKGEGGLRTRGYFKKSYDKKPLISVVTVVYNGERHLEQTINSVLDQTYDNVEYIIIDGGSTDRTINIIKRYEEQIDYWVSKPDSGIYDAMNKGISLISGEYMGFLNADDWYLNDSIESIVTSVIKVKIGYVFGRAYLYNENKFVGVRYPNLKVYKRGTPMCHQTLFVKSLYLRQMPFNIKYKIMADYDFMVKLIILNIPFVQQDRSLVNYRVTGLSSISNLKKEKFLVQFNHFGILSAIYTYIRSIVKTIVLSLIKTLIYLKQLIQYEKIKS